MYAGKEKNIFTKTHKASPIVFATYSRKQSSGVDDAVTESENNNFLVNDAHD